MLAWEFQPSGLVYQCSTHCYAPSTSRITRDIRITCKEKNHVSGRTSYASVGKNSPSGVFFLPPNRNDMVWCLSNERYRCSATPSGSWWNSLDEWLQCKFSLPDMVMQDVKYVSRCISQRRGSAKGSKSTQKARLQPWTVLAWWGRFTTKDSFDLFFRVWRKLAGLKDSSFFWAVRPGDGTLIPRIIDLWRARDQIVCLG
jgi:hypothetical protein